MNKKIILPFVVLMVLAMVGAASAITTADDVKVRGTIVEAIPGTVAGWNITEAGSDGLSNDTAYNWGPYNYAAFWYSLDSDLSTEYLNITELKPTDNRTIGEKNLTYTTKPVVQSYQFSKDNVSAGGKDGELGTIDSNPVKTYYIEGWMAEKYVAISTGGSTNKNANKIVELLVEFKSSSDKQTLATEDAWDLGGGFTLTAKQIDLQGNKVWLSLGKNGKEIDSSVIDANTDSRYMYTETLSGVENVVVFFCNVDAVFRGTESNLVQVKYVFLIDNDVEKIVTSTTYGNMEVKTAGADRIVLHNDGDIDLGRNTEVEIMKDMYFKVADNDTVRFYPYKLYTEPGDYDVRGTIVEAIPGTVAGWNITVAGSDGLSNDTAYNWGPYNYAAFWYDLDDDLSTEYLNITELKPNDNRTIGEKNLTYTTRPVVQSYQFSKDNVTAGGKDGELGTIDSNPVKTYYIEGWMAEKYVAISTGGSTNKNANKIVELLVEFKSSSDKQTLATEDEWDLGGGFTLTAKQIDLQGNKVWLSLGKNGKEIDSSVIDANTDSRYMYTETLSGVENVVVFFCNVDAVFRGTESNLVQVKYVFLIDNDVEKIVTSTTYGNMEVKTAGADRIVLHNDGDIDLGRNTDAEIMKDMYFKVADNSTVRFYPYKIVTIEGADDDEVPKETPTEAANVTAEANVTPAEVVTPAPTPAATAVVTATTAEETATTAEPEADKKKTPGFEAVFAIAGLLAVAYLVLRQRE